VIAGEEVAVHLDGTEEMIVEEEVALEGIEEIQTVGMIEGEVVVVHATIVTDLDTLLEIAQRAGVMTAEEEEVLEEIVVIEEVEAEHATTATKKDTWQETVPMETEGIEEGDNFQSNSNKQIRSKLDLVTTYRQRNEIYLLSHRGNTPIGLFCCEIEKTMII